jgi:hypothetical protein
MDLFYIGILAPNRRAPFAPFHRTFAPKKNAHLRLKVALFGVLFKYAFFVKQILQKLSTGSE